MRGVQQMQPREVRQQVKEVPQQVKKPSGKRRKLLRLPLKGRVPGSSMTIPIMPKRQ